MNLPLHSRQPAFHDATEIVSTVAHAAPVHPSTSDADIIHSARQCALREHFRHIRESSYVPVAVDVFRVH